MVPSQYEELLLLFQRVVPVQSLKSKLPIRQQLHMYLYCVGNNPYATEMADQFAFSSPLNVVYNVAELINEHLYCELVKWPSEHEKSIIKQDFESFTGFKNIIGAVDGTHVVIGGIGKFRAGYTTRKCMYAINVTIVCDFYKHILFAAVGCPGAYHDNRVFEYTDLFLNPGNYFKQRDIILGDSAYRASNQMVVPYISPVESSNISFNYLHARGRVKVENTIGLWKGKFKINGTAMRQKKLINVVVLVKSTIPIHNFIIKYNRSNDIEDETADDEHSENTNQSEIEQLTQHRSLNARVSLNAHNRREQMKNTNV